MRATSDCTRGAGDTTVIVGWVEPGDGVHASAGGKFPISESRVTMSLRSALHIPPFRNQRAGDHSEGKGGCWAMGIRRRGQPVAGEAVL